MSFSVVSGYTQNVGSLREFDSPLDLGDVRDMCHDILESLACRNVSMEEARRCEDIGSQSLLERNRDRSRGILKGTADVFVETGKMLVKGWNWLTRTSLDHKESQVREGMNTVGGMALREYYGRRGFGDDVTFLSSLKAAGGTATYATYTLGATISSLITHAIKNYHCYNREERSAYLGSGVGELAMEGVSAMLSGGISLAGHAGLIFIARGSRVLKRLEYDNFHQVGDAIVELDKNSKKDFLSFVPRNDALPNENDPRIFIRKEDEGPLDGYWITADSLEGMEHQLDMAKADYYAAVADSPGRSGYLGEDMRNPLDEKRLEEAVDNAFRGRDSNDGIDSLLFVNTDITSRRARAYDLYSMRYGREALTDVDFDANPNLRHLNETIVRLEDAIADRKALVGENKANSSASRLLMHPFQKINDIINISKQASRSILDFYDRNDFAISNKADQTLLTEADLASNKIITDRLKEEFPDIPVVSEEAVIPF